MTGASWGEAAGLGPFFGLQDDVGPDGTSWAELTGDPTVLARRIAEVAGLLGRDAEPRVVASLVHLGVVARLLSPAVGAALTTGLLPVPEGIRLSLAGSNPMPMAWTDVVVVDTPTPAAIVAELTRHWLTARIAPWTDRVAATGLSRQVLAGNTVSAVVGAVTIASTARPDLADRGRAVVDALIERGGWAGTGTRRCDGSFRRASCCLFYRVPGGGTCADCVLDRPVPA